MIFGLEPICSRLVCYAAIVPDDCLTQWTAWFGGRNGTCPEAGSVTMDAKQSITG